MHSQEAVKHIPVHLHTPVCSNILMHFLFSHCAFPKLSGRRAHASFMCRCRKEEGAGQWFATRAVSMDPKSIVQETRVPAESTHSKVASYDPVKKIKNTHDVRNKGSGN